MYDAGEDISNSPFIQSGQWRHHVSSNGTMESARSRQTDLIELYKSIKQGGYNGSLIQIWFDEEGKVHVYDGFHRIIIMNYLGMDELVNATTNWTEPPKIRFTGKDFPIQDRLKDKWLYQPVEDHRLSKWNVARPDSSKRLDFIIENLIGKTVLDIGCSEGYFSRGIAKQGYEVTGIDCDYNLVAVARYLTILDGLKITYYADDWSRVSKLGHFDNILLLSVIHNEMKQIGVEAELKKLQLLKGKTSNLFLEVPNNTNEKQWNVAGFPNYDFHANIEKIADSLDMRVAGSYKGVRVIYRLSALNLTLEQVNGYPMYLFKDELYITRMARDGTYEPKTVQFLRDNLKLGQVFVDVGANVGFFTILASKLVGDTGKVYAFEPSLDCFEVLKRNVELNSCKNVELFQVALGNKTGVSKLFKPNPISYGQQYIEEAVVGKDKLDYEQYDVKEMLSGKYETITIKRLDEILTAPPDMVKVDVEGAERLVLEGMGNLLGKTNTIIIEDLDQTVHPWLIQQGFSNAIINYERRNCILQRHKPTPKVLAKPRFHILGVPYTKTRKDYYMCPFTQLTYRMCEMMMELGYEVYHYGAEGSDVPCTEQVDIVSDKLQHDTYGDFDWKHKYWNFSRDDTVFKAFASNAIEQINRRKQHQDILLTVNGRTDKAIADTVGLTTVEYAIGYEGVFSKFRVFASYAWMHYVYGKLNMQNGNWYDAVIPHYFNVDDFKLQEKEDYFLYLGRLVPRKGPHIAAQVCEKIGAKLIISGQGDPKSCDLDKPFIERVDISSLKEKTELIGKARAVFCPTMYIEPFNMVSIEALLSGTPVICTDWGAFTETIRHGEVGYRCRTFDDFLWAVKNIDRISPKRCRDYASANYSMERIAKAYQEYFIKVQDLQDRGWYTEHPERIELDWLRRY
jgi:FkbM family methyltransferase